MSWVKYTINFLLIGLVMSEIYSIQPVRFYNGIPNKNTKDGHTIWFNDSRSSRSGGGTLRLSNKELSFQYSDGLYFSQCTFNITHNNKSYRSELREFLNGSLEKLYSRTWLRFTVNKCTMNFEANFTDDIRFGFGANGKNLKLGFRAEFNISSGYGSFDFDLFKLDYPETISNKSGLFMLYKGEYSECHRKYYNCRWLNNQLRSSDSTINILLDHLLLVWPLNISHSIINKLLNLKSMPWPNDPFQSLEESDEIKIINYLLTKLIRGEKADAIINELFFAKLTVQSGSASGTEFSGELGYDFVNNKFTFSFSAKHNGIINGISVTGNEITPILDFGFGGNVFEWPNKAKEACLIAKNLLPGLDCNIPTCVPIPINGLEGRCRCLSFDSAWRGWCYPRHCCYAMFKDGFCDAKCVDDMKSC